MDATVSATVGTTAFRLTSSRPTWWRSPLECTLQPQHFLVALTSETLSIQCGCAALSALVAARRPRKHQRPQVCRKAEGAVTPVPESFEDAVSMAHQAALRAIKEGKPHQTIYYGLGGVDDLEEDNDDEGGTMQFVIELGAALVSSLSDDGGVSVRFSRAQDMAHCQQHWVPRPDALHVCTIADDPVRVQNAALLLIVGRSEEDLPQLLAASQSSVPAIVIHDVSKLCPTLAQNLTPSFHLDQWQPEEEGDLNEAVIAQAWPGPFSIWEDCTEDDEADGFRLLGVLPDTEPPTQVSVRNMVAASRNEVVARRKALAAAKYQLRYQDYDQSPNGL